MINQIYQPNSIYKKTKQKRAEIKRHKNEKRSIFVVEERNLYSFNAPIDQFQYIKIQPKTKDFSTRLWEINTEFVGFIPQSLVLMSIV